MSGYNLEDHPFYKKLQKRWNEINRRERKNKSGEPLEMSLQTFIDLSRVSSRDALKKREFQEKQGISKLLFFQLYTICQINPKKLLLPKKEEKTWLKNLKKQNKDEKHYFTRAYWEELKPFIPPPNPNIEVKSIPDLPPKTMDGDELKRFYERIADTYYKAAKSSIEVHELLLKGNNNDPGEFSTYREAQQVIFNAIDDTLKNHETSETFKYRRVFYLSPSNSVHNQPATDEDIINRFILEASSETLLHIKDCFAYPEGLCEFYVAPFSTFRAHCLIDDEVFITEDYQRYMHNQESYIVPNFLYIDNVSTDSDLLKLKTEFDKVLGNQPNQRSSSKIIKLDKHGFSDYIKDCEEYLTGENGEIEKRTKSIEMLTEIQRNRLKLEHYNWKTCNRLIKHEKEILRILEKQKTILTSKVRYLGL